MSDSYVIDDFAKTYAVAQILQIYPDMWEALSTETFQEHISEAISLYMVTSKSIQPILDPQAYERVFNEMKARGSLSYLNDADTLETAFEFLGQIVSLYLSYFTKDKWRYLV